MDFLSEDVKDYIDNCPQCIMTKKGNVIKPKAKVIITKGPLERLVADGWDLMSIPIKNNNTNNILFCLKEYFSYIESH